MDEPRVVGPARRRRVALAAAVLALGSAAAMAGGQASAASHPGVTAAPGTISTIAGGVGGPDPATKVAVIPCGLATGNGRLYLGDSAVVRTVNPQTDWLSTSIGSVPENNPSFPRGGDGGLAVHARLAGACGVDVDAAGNVLVADSDANRVSVVAHASGTFYGRAMTAGHIYLLAGTGATGATRSGELAVQARLDFPQDVTLDAAGNVVITSFDGFVHVVAEHTGTFYQQPMTAGHIYNVAGGGRKLGDGGLATEAEIGQPNGLALDGNGNLLIADTFFDRIRVVAEKTGTFYGVPMTTGDIYTVAGDGAAGYNGDGGPAASAEVNGPHGVAVDPAGNLVLTDSLNSRVRVVAATTGTFYGQSMTAGDIYTVAGTGQTGATGFGGPATSAELDFPAALMVDGSGNLIFGGSSRTLLIAAKSGPSYGRPMTAGDIYSIAGNGHVTSGIGGLASRAVIRGPAGVAVDSGSGNLAVDDFGSNQILVSAATAGTLYGQPMTAGHLYLVAGDGELGSSGNGGLAVKAKLDAPDAVGVDQAGNLLISDGLNSQVRVVAAKSGTFYGRPVTAGHIYALAGTGKNGFTGDGGPATQAKLDDPGGMAVDAAGNVVFSDGGNSRVRVVAASSGTFYGQPMTAGDIYTIAGGGTSVASGVPATSANIGPSAVVFDAAGNLVITEGNSGEIWVVAGSTGPFYQQPMTAGDIYLVAGGGASLAEGVAATSASLNFPDSVAVDASGNLALTDTGNNRVRVVAESNGTFYGVAMTTGDIYTVAGSFTDGLAGDGGPGLKAELNEPFGVTTDNGNLVIADSNNSRVRQVTG